MPSYSSSQPKTSLPPLIAVTSTASSSSTGDIIVPPPIYPLPAYYTFYSILSITSYAHYLLVEKTKTKTKDQTTNNKQRRGSRGNRNSNNNNYHAMSIKPELIAVSVIPYALPADHPLVAVKTEAAPEKKVRRREVKRRREKTL